MSNALLDFIKGLLGDESLAVQFAGDPHGTLALQGVTQSDLVGVDIAEAVEQAASQLTLPAAQQTAVQNFTSGSASSAPASSGGGGGGGYTPPAAGVAASQAQAVQQLQHVTYVSYPHNEYIQQEINNFDNSTNFDVEIDGDNYGDLEFDVDNQIANAVGDGSVAVAGEDNDVNAATGDQAQVIDGDNYGNANTGDNAAVGVTDSAVNTGTNTGVIADGDVYDTVVGDGNQVANVDGELDGSVLNFGDGDVSNINDSTLDDTAVATGGDATNVSDNYLEDGSAISTGGDATGGGNDITQTTEVYDNDYTSEYTDVDAYDSNVATEQGDGTLDQEAEVNEQLEEL